MPTSPLWVVKLGGSFWAAEALLAWLEVLDKRGVIVVPGGGLFADAVREAQQRWGFDDQLAHRLAISAMHQYGLMLQGLCPALQTRTQPGLLKDPIGNGQSTLWLPDAESLADQRIRASWDVTSDSLAAWLAENLGAEHLLLIKSVNPPAGEATISDLIDMDLVDRAFAEVSKNFSGNIWLTGPQQYRRFMAGVAKPDRFFTRALSL
ncbi:MAG: hypothetical protein RL661_378 [Pseudomonadota bacterium]|jgi:aspartokinase-like uncharacterized kinase